MKSDLDLANLTDYASIRDRRDLRLLAGWTETEANMVETIEFKIATLNNRILSATEDLIRDFGYARARVNNGSRLFDSLSTKTLTEAMESRETLIEVLADLHAIVESRIES